VINFTGTDVDAMIRSHHEPLIEQMIIAIFSAARITPRDAVDAHSPANPPTARAV